MRNSYLGLMSMLCVMACNPNEPPKPGDSPSGGSQNPPQTPAIQGGDSNQPSKNLSQLIIDEHAPSPGQKFEIPKLDPQDWAEVPGLTDGKATGPLQVVSATPSGDCIGNCFPTVVFNQPIQALGDHRTDIPFEITPNTEGEWRPMGSRTLEFRPSKPWPKSTEISVRIPKGFKGSNNATLEEDKRFSFITERVSIYDIETERCSWNCERVKPDELFVITLSQPVVSESLVKVAYIQPEDGEAHLPLKVVKVGEYNTEQESQKIWVTPEKPLALDQRYKLVVEPGLQSQYGSAPSLEKETFSFKTYGPFVLNNAWSYNRSEGSFQFTNSFELAQIKDKVQCKPAIPEFKLDLSAEKSYSVPFFGKMEPEETYHCTIQGPINDVFGQPLADEQTHKPVKSATVEWTVDPIDPFLIVPDDEHLLEAGLSAKLPVRHANLFETRGYWKEIPSTGNPFNRSWDDRRYAQHVEDMKPFKLVLPNQTRNRYLRSPWDLKPMLGNRKYGVFEYLVLDDDSLMNPSQKPYYNWGFIQITDLGIFSFITGQSMDVYVWSLSTGKPASGVTVEWCDRVTSDCPDKAMTDEKGTVRFNALPHKGGGFLRATLNEDVAYLSTSEIEVGRDDSTRGTLWTDRDAYRPGEKIHVKGILRQVNGITEQNEQLTGNVTVKLEWPDGTKESKEVALTPFGGLYASFDVPAQTSLGDVEIEVEKDANNYLSHRNDQMSPYKLRLEHHVRIAEFRTPKYKLDAHVAQKEVIAGEEIRVDLEGRYLYGAAMGGAAVNWRENENLQVYSPSNSDGFDFGINSYERSELKDYLNEDKFETSHHDEGEGVLDQNGAYSIQRKSTVFKGYSSVAEFYMTVLDLDRQEQRLSRSVVVHPARYYVGLRTPVFSAEKQPLTVEGVARASIGGERLTVPNVTVKLLREECNTVRQENRFGEFEEISQCKWNEVGQCDLPLKAEEIGKCDVTPQESGRHMVFVETQDEAGRLLRSVRDIWIHGESYAPWHSPSRDEENRSINIHLDQEKYQVGDKAKILIENPFGVSDAWILVTRNRILWQEHRHFDSNSQLIELPITAEMIPNVSVYVLVSRGRVGDPQTKGDPGRPDYFRGSANIEVYDSQKLLKLELKPDAQKKAPQDELTVDVNVADFEGKPVEAEVTLWVVNEGSLLLTNYREPDVQKALISEGDYWWSRRVAFDTNLDGLIPQLAYGEKGKEPGGDGGEESEAAQSALNAKDNAMRSNFVATPIFIDAAYTDASGHVQVKGRLPDTLTQYRIMATAVDKTDRAGGNRTSITVSKDLFSTAATPRSVRVGDRFAAGVVIQAPGAKTAKEVEVRCEAEGLKALEPLTRKISIDNHRGQEVRFAFEALQEGEAKFRFYLKSDIGNDALEAKLPVTRPQELETFAIFGETEGESMEQLAVPSKPLRSDIGGLNVTLTSSALTGLKDDAQMLIDYPYGCLEQRSSRLLPFVVLKSLVDRQQLVMPGARNYEEVIQENLLEIDKMQRSSGGFAYWADSRYIHYYATAWAYLALSELKRSGHDIGKIDLQRAGRYLVNQFKGSKDDPRSPEEQAVALFALTRNGDPQPALEKILLQEPPKSNFGQAMLASVLARPGSGYQDKANEILDRLFNQAEVEGDRVRIAEADGLYSRYFSSNVRTTALTLMAAIQLRPDHPFVPRMARTLMSSRKGRGYRTTQEAGVSLLALRDYVNKFETSTEDFKGQVLLDGQEILSAMLNHRRDEAIEKSLKMAELPKDLRVPFKFELSGKGRLYYTARLRYALEKPEVAEKDEGLSVQRWYTLKDKEDGVRSVSEGDLVTVHLRIATHKARYYVAIVDPMPSGLESIDHSLAIYDDDSEGEEKRDYAFDHVELRDDRVLLFASDLAPGVHEFTYTARATSPGTFELAPVHAEEMYNPEVFGQSSGGSFFVYPK